MTYYNDPSVIVSSFTPNKQYLNLYKS